MDTEFDFTVVKRYYHISPEGADSPIYELPAARFMNPEDLLAALHTSGQTVQAISNALPGSFIGTSLCKLGNIQLLFAAQYDRLIDLSADNLIYQIERHGDHTHLGYKIKELRSAPIPSSLEQREAFWIAHWQSFFGEFITPSVEAIAAGAGLKAEAIWQQFGGQLTLLKEFLSEHEPRADVLRKFEEDSRTLAEQIEPEWFKRRRNPFVHQPRYTENPLNPEEKWQIQSSCCMYDRRENGVKCYTCPRMTAAEREEQACAMLESAGAGA
ncbi:(2Fe-2S)-binding protein [Paenibacillus sp. NPDC058174]|uniref:(2Fe-2S)-binding protein n=1 Tax=Paenibacillus sp. NPDC058174 TaxID=3346366 RepID=UPI0036DB11AC